MDHLPTITVIIPLCSIDQEQLKCHSFCLKALELTLNDQVLKNVREGKGEVVYTSAENVLHDKFLSVLSDSNCHFRWHLKLIVVDESHTVFTC